MANIEQEKQYLQKAEAAGLLSRPGRLCETLRPGWLQSAITLGGGSLASVCFLECSRVLVYSGYNPWQSFSGVIMLSPSVMSPSPPDKAHSFRLRTKLIPCLPGVGPLPPSWPMSFGAFPIQFGNRCSHPKSLAGSRSYRWKSRRLCGYAYPGDCSNP